MTLELASFLSGAIAMSFAVCACFFMRFWARTKDILFAAFSLAFLILAVSQLLTTILGLPLEERSWLFALRFVAFSLIILAIVIKNIAKR